MKGDGFQVVGCIVNEVYGETLFTNFSNSNIVVLFNNGEVVHSGKVNSSGANTGTMDDNAGYSVTQNNKTRIPGENGVSRGLSYDKSVFYKATQPDKIINTNDGQVVNGVRIINE